MKFANIIFDRKERLTIGDDIQLLAIERLYKYMNVDYNDVIRIPFHQLSSYNGEYVILPISFPLYGYHDALKITQFSDRIIPVFLALSTLTNVYDEKEVEYLRRFEPIGCRDLHTMKALREHGVMAYLNCCMTTTLERRPSTIQGETIYCIDVQDTLDSYIPKEIKEKAVFSSHTFYPEELKNGPEEKARELLNEYYHKAKLIITSRLHAALPCAAMGIPTILVKDELSYRFLGVNRILHVYTKDEYDKINWNPAPVEIENIKILMLENAKNRILEQKEKYEKMCEISTFFEDINCDNYYVEFYSNTIDFIRHNFMPEQEFSYCLWGITQTASMVNKYIKENYPKAKLVGVIDKKKRMVYDNIQTTTKESIAYDKDNWFFVCTGAAIKESYEYFEKMGHKRYYQCCEDGKKHSCEAKYLNSYNNVSI